MTDDTEAVWALEASASEQSELDNLLITLTSSGLGFSVALGVFQPDNETGWLMAGWIALLCSVLAVLSSKFVAVEALRAFYVVERHVDENQKELARQRATRLDGWVQRLNYSGGALFFSGAGFLVLHVIRQG